MHKHCLTTTIFLVLSQLSWGEYVCDTTSIKGDTAVMCSTLSKGGALVAVDPYLNGRLHGQRVSWYANGTLKRISPYRNGERVDTSYTYYSDGSLQIRGVQNGITMVFTDTGDTLAITPMCHGNICGTTKAWYPDGRPKSIIHYNDSGQKHGLSETWREDGTRKDSTVYDKGTMVEVRAYYTDGTQRMWEKYKNRDLLWSGIYHDPQGNVNGRVRKGKGEYILFTENGAYPTRRTVEEGRIVEEEYLDE